MREFLRITVRAIRKGSDPVALNRPLIHAFLSSKSMFDASDKEDIVFLRRLAKKELGMGRPPHYLLIDFVL